jgi:hypothetical protein
MLAQHVRSAPTARARSNNHNIRLSIVIKIFEVAAGHGTRAEIHECKRIGYFPVFVPPIIRSSTSPADMAPLRRTTKGTQVIGSASAAGGDIATDLIDLLESVLEFWSEMGSMILSLVLSRSSSIAVWSQNLFDDCASMFSACQRG